MQYGQGRASARPFRLRGAGMVKGARLWGVAALCMLSGSGWLMTEVWPSEIGAPFSGAIHFATIACVAGAVASAQRKSGLSARSLGGLVCAGVCLFALPGIVLQMAAGAVPEFTSVTLFCSLPVMTVLAAAAVESGSAAVDRGPGFLVAGVLGLAGAVLLFPFETPYSLRRWLYLAVVGGCCVAVALASLWMHRLMRGEGVAAAVAVVGVGCSLVLAGYGFSVGWPAMSMRVVAVECMRCAAFDLPVVWLSVLLMREVNPARLSARFLLVPLVTAVEGYVGMRGGFDLIAVAAMALMLGGGVALLVFDETEDAAGLQLR